jgi:hypothetical protein
LRALLNELRHPAPINASSLEPPFASPDRVRPVRSARPSRRSTKGTRRQPRDATPPPILRLAAARVAAAMARKKAAARRHGAILKPPAAREPALATASARLSLADRFAAAAPTHVYTSPRSRVRGEVLRLAPPTGASPGWPVRGSPAQGRRHRGGCAATAPRLPTHTHVVFLPGNPGVIECYRRWLCELVERLPLDVRSATSVHGVGYPGHDVRELNGPTVFGITDHVSYVRDYLSSAQLSPPLSASRVVFLGHSFGSFLALRILNADKALAARAHIVMLMPAVHRMSDCRPPLVRLITHRAASNVLVPTVNTLARLLPRAAVRAAFRAAGVVEGGSNAALSRMFDGRRGALFENCLSLAREEMEQIQHPADEPACAMVGASRAYLYWTEDDAWCKADSVDAIRTAFGDLVVEHAGPDEGVTHAFSTDVPQLEAVARCVAYWITGICRAEADV